MRGISNDQVVGFVSSASGDSQPSDPGRVDGRSVEIVRGLLRGYFGVDYSSGCGIHRVIGRCRDGVVYFAGRENINVVVYMTLGLGYWKIIGLW